MIRINDNYEKCFILRFKQKFFKYDVYNIINVQIKNVYFKYCYSIRKLNPISRIELLIVLLDFLCYLLFFMNKFF